MNYIKVINNFCCSYTQKPISEKVVSLFFAIFNYANKNHWKMPLKFTNSIIRRFKNMSKSMFFRAREELALNGYIEYGRLSKKEGCRYFLCVSDSSDKKLLWLRGNLKENKKTCSSKSEKDGIIEAEKEDLL